MPQNGREAPPGWVVRTSHRADRIYYRLRKHTAVIVHKDHVTRHLDDTDMDRFRESFRESFLDTPWEAPDQIAYGHHNPFEHFEASDDTLSINREVVPVGEKAGLGAGGKPIATSTSTSTFDKCGPRRYRGIQGRLPAPERSANLCRR